MYATNQEAAAERIIYWHADGIDMPASVLEKISGNINSRRIIRIHTQLLSADREKGFRFVNSEKPVIRGLIIQAVKNERDSMLLAAPVLENQMLFCHASPLKDDVLSTNQINILNGLFQYIAEELLLRSLPSGH